ncbi:MAG: division/cell wall cluster transcriptional repressor MraZ [Candidatus Omnitrophica bacterium]|jgi:MraZ protein|nr:division/cell wall cluster transcriptional repressor MraZ [Candidatus Omnitrophota bacterium]MCF7891703.1 division/cell wall cluster transcriptional repressor MraZ [Candidatus Omnitrophota bacterium]MCF7895601.1 division/cell wall cluster transcriptional repressor MraZ [Candidatus Omnitrophota bacterium]MCF7897879.1 division/cell wall cluster transcriptional repressor MraZ [Candidatus Omnitrophota bacterium]MCF7909117.1 division/cell wall cluster transcriptional repressor MraZ [Candidatus Om
MWYGQYLHTLDKKDRFVLPVKFREKIKEEENFYFYITRGLDGCLFLYSKEVWKKLEDKLQSLSFTNQKPRFFNRIFFSGASEIEIAPQGRIMLPQNLKQFASIKKEIIITGVGNRIEIWDKDRWDQFYLKNKNNFEKMAEDLFQI